MPSPHNPNQNHLLAALPEAEFERLAPISSWSPMLLGEILYEPGGQLQHAYFPTTSIVSLHYVTESGASAETAGVGNEGVVGISLFMGGEHHAEFGRRARPRAMPIGWSAALLKQEFDRAGAAAATAAALYAGADHADDPDRRLQSAPLGRAATVPLAADDPRSRPLAASWS